MAQNIVIKNAGNLGGLIEEIETDDFVTFVVDGQLYGIPVLQVSNIFNIENIAGIPLAPPQVKGSINLRGRIVTVIDVRTCLGLPQNPENADGSSNLVGVTIEQGNELYTLLVDQVGEVISVSAEQREPVTQNIDRKLKDIALNIYRLENELLIILNPDQLISSEPT